MHTCRKLYDYISRYATVISKVDVRCCINKTHIPNHIVPPDINDCFT